MKLKIEVAYRKVCKVEVQVADLSCRSESLKGQCSSCRSKLQTDCAVCRTGVQHNFLLLINRNKFVANPAPYGRVS